MGKFGKSELHQNNVLRLVKALLLLAQENSKLEDSQLSTAVQAKWVQDAKNRLEVTGEDKRKTRTGKEKLEKGTTKQALWQLVEKTVTPLELPPRQGDKSSRTKQERQDYVLKSVFEYLEELGVFKDERPENKRNTRYWIFTLTLKDKDASLEDNLEIVKQKLGLETSSSTDISIDWRTICRTKLEKQKQLTTNRLMRADEMLFDINQICVDLALVERKKPDKRSGDDNPEQSQSYKPDYEETEKLEYNDFITQVLKSEPSKNIAIIGEPGAGKTTLLQRIAFWILENTNGLPIWIPLGTLPTATPTLKDYLLHHWLEDAIVSVTPKIKTEFEELLTAGRVWLLLDGVDEMVANFGNPLSFINNWIPGWCHHLSVVLTCRLNVWEANPHALNNFKTYRTLEFSQEKVEEFIQACFQNRRGAPTCAHELGIQLQQALNQPGKERIKDLVKNPLRLTLLCSTWHLQEGKLPDTKAELYQQFVEEVYRWKKDEFPTTPEQRKQINAKLKELAREAIDKEENRFCLRHKFVEGILGDREALLRSPLASPKGRSADREGSVFQLALNIGWLNQVGVDAKNPNPNQPVYAFFHPTFQEYFAALAIDDWDFFLPRAHDNRNPKLVSERYRIFEPQWKEVILLWLGCEEVTKEQKEDFLKALVEFEDGCGDENFFGYKAHFLTAYGISELRNYSHADEVIEQLVQWIFIAEECPMTLAWNAKVVLRETYCSRAIKPLTQLLHTEYSIHNECDEWIIFQIAQCLGQIPSGKLEAVNVLTKLMHASHNEYLKEEAAETLRKIETGKSWDEQMHQQVAENYGETANPEMIDELIEVARTHWDEFTRVKAIKKLGKVSDGNSDSVKVLTELLTDSDEAIRLKAAESLGKIYPGNSDAIKTLTQILRPRSYYNWQEAIRGEEIRSIAAQSLGEIGVGNVAAIRALIDVFHQSIVSEVTHSIAAQSLERIIQAQWFPIVVSSLKDCRSHYEDCSRVIWHCAQKMTYPAFYQAWHQQEEVENTTTPNSQSLNQADLPQSLQTAITNDPQLSQIIHLICIDSSQCIEPNNPAEIYDQMLDQNCPEYNLVPETMSALKLYWKSVKRNSHKRPFLVFYTSSTHPYNQAFLTALSKFGHEICVITEQPIDPIPLKYFTPSQSIKDILEWIRTN